MTEMALATSNWSGWLYSFQSTPKNKCTKLLEYTQEFNHAVIQNDGYAVNKDSYI